MKNVQDRISRPLRSREIQNPAEHALMHTLYKDLNIFVSQLFNLCLLILDVEQNILIIRNPLVT